MEVPFGGILPPPIQANTPVFGRRTPPQNPIHPESQPLELTLPPPVPTKKLIFPPIGIPADLHQPKEKLTHQTALSILQS